MTQTTRELRPPRVEPDAVYDDGDLRLMLGLTSATTARARREGRLRYSRLGQRVLYLGKWVTAWLEQNATEQAHPRKRGRR